jgi:hypothetical protein
MGCQVGFDNWIAGWEHAAVTHAYQIYVFTSIE